MLTVKIETLDRGPNQLCAASNVRSFAVVRDEDLARWTASATHPPKLLDSGVMAPLIHFFRQATLEPRLLSTEQVINGQLYRFSRVS